VTDGHTDRQTDGHNAITII